MDSTRYVQIPKLGEVRGIHNPGTGLTTFLGIPYGSVSKRWTRAVPIESFQGGKHDGTNHGPICAQAIEPGTPSITQLSVPGFPPNSNTKMSEFECLNLNILKPEAGTAPMPVLVWIHGGGLAIGSNSENVYSGTELLKASIEAENPVVYVAIKFVIIYHGFGSVVPETLNSYRLGPFGFLSSKSMAKQMKGDAVGNYGLFDQRLALQFIKTHIHRFGGNPDLITIFGESAGGASVHAHSLCKEQLFAQAICQSGVVRTLGPLKVQHPCLNGQYMSLLERLGYDESISIEGLRQTSAEAIVNAMAELSHGALIPYYITDDTEFADGFFPKNTDWITRNPFCKRLMIGDCMVEGIIMAKTIGRIPQKEVARLLSTLPHSYLQDSGLLGNANKPEMQAEAMIRLATEVIFFGPIEGVIAASPPDSTYVYRFDRANHWGPGPLQGLAHHTIDLLYLAGLPKKFPTDENEIDLNLAETMIKHWVDFSVGKEPWSSKGGGGLEMWYKENGVAVETRRRDITTRRFAEIGALTGENVNIALDVNTSLSTGFVY